MRSGMAQGVVVMREWKIKGATSQFAHIEKFSFYFSNLSFAIRVSFLHPLLSLFRYSCCGASVASEQQHKQEQKGVRILEFITFYQNALHLTRVHFATFYQSA